MSDYIWLTIVIVQWGFLGWYIFGARVERKRLTNDIIAMIDRGHATAHASAPTPYETITMPHPDTGDPMQFRHVGDGTYIPETPQPNNVAEFEGVT